MAIDPATLKVIAKVATSVASDEKGRRAILIACFLPFIVILVVLSSPFAIFFAVTDNGTTENVVSVMSTMNSLKQEFQYQIEMEQSDTSVDEVHTVIMGSEENSFIDNVADVLMVYAAIYNVVNENANQIAVLSQEQVTELSYVYWDMNTIYSSIESVSEDVTVTTIDANGNETTEIVTVTRNIKTIYIDSLSAEEIASYYGFDETQLLVIQEMRTSGYGALVSMNSVTTFLTQEQIEAIRAYMPSDLSIERTQVVDTALSLVGQVNYFWGGKSVAIGWDSRWGTDMEVTSVGSSETGTIRPFGLDCSGYVTWVFANMGLLSETIDTTIGHGTTAQWNTSSSIPKSAALPGDLAFIAVPGTRKVNHIGIVVGEDGEGDLMIAHCTSGANNVVVTTAESVGFMYFRRPAVLID